MDMNNQSAWRQNLDSTGALKKATKTETHMNKSKKIDSDEQKLWSENFKKVSCLRMLKYCKDEEHERELSFRLLNNEHSLQDHGDGQTFLNVKKESACVLVIVACGN